LTVAYAGTFDGRGFEVQNLTINRPAETQVGLFSEVHTSGVIIDLGVSGNVTGGVMTAGLVGLNDGTITNTYSKALVTGTSDAGGLVGHNLTSAVINNSYATGDVTGTYNVGGLIGMGAGTISYSYAIGDVTSTGNYTDGGAYAGGFIGQANSTPVMVNCYATGNVVTSGGNTGGFIGNLVTGTISNAYATGSVTNNAPTTQTTGKFAGASAGTMTNIYTYADSTLVGTGGLSGDAE
jgi:hypothetical protein